MTGVHHTILKCPERGPDIYVTEQVQTIYPASYQDQISIFDFSMRPSADGGSAFPRPDCPLQPQSRCPHGTNPGRTHRFYTGRAVVPFGTVSACIVLDRFPASILEGRTHTQLIHSAGFRPMYLPASMIVSEP